MKRSIVLSTFFLVIILSACGQEEAKKDTPNENKEDTKITNGIIGSSNFYEPFEGNIEHIHGLGYAGNQNAAFFAAHDGLKVYEDGRWYKTKEENNDYMGFNATSSGFYSSGHPGADSDLPNPLGIKKSSDNGKTLQNVTLEGETDFHTMAVGFENNTIYAQSPQENSVMESNKFYFSEDQGDTWKQVAAKGIEGQVLSIATHPENPSLVATAAEGGVFLSEDRGESFTMVGKDMQGTSVYFTEDSLWYAGYNGAAVLVKRSLKDGGEEHVPLPEMEQDAVMYLAQNPKNKEEITFVSFKGNIYQSKDGSQSWELLVNEGELE